MKNSRTVRFYILDVFFKFYNILTVLNVLNAVKSKNKWLDCTFSLYEGCLGPSITKTVKTQGTCSSILSSNSAELPAELS